MCDSGGVVVVLSAGIGIGGSLGPALGVLFSFGGGGSGFSKSIRRDLGGGGLSGSGGLGLGVSDSNNFA
jgi:hypothetical protein